MSNRAHLRSTDKHLNIFWNYNGNPHWEDNITKAFINTLSMSSKRVQVDMIELLLKEKISYSIEDLDIEYDLQNPFIQDIEALDCKKYLVGISPTGKVWGDELVEVFNRIQFDRVDIDKIKSNSYLKEVLGEKYVEERKKEFQEALIRRKTRGDSRPDAWIFIYNKGQLEIIIALESKLWDLDPYQLDNHLEKSLGLSSNSSYLLYKFEDICKALKTFNFNKNEVGWHFIDYMEKLGYFINTEEISREDLRYVLQNKDNSILRRKWNKYIKSFFNSEEYKNLQKLYGLEKREGVNQLHIEELGGIGNLYFDPILNFNNDIEDNDNIFFIGTEIGVSSRWWSDRVSESIENREFIEELEKIYGKIQGYNPIYEVFCRVNCLSKSMYFQVEEYLDLSKCLERKKDIPYITNLTKEGCIDELKGYIKEEYLDVNFSLNEDMLNHKVPCNNHIVGLIRKIDKWKWGREESKSRYNLLSYLRLIDYIPLSTLECKSQKEFNKLFGQMVERHVKGLRYIWEFSSKKS